MEKEKIKEIIKVGWLTAAIYSLISLALLLALHFNLLISKFAQGGELERLLVVRVETTLESFFSTTAFQGFRISLYILGGLLVGYIVLWTVFNLIIHLINTIIYQVQYTHIGSFASRFKSALSQVILAAVFVGLLLATLLFGLAAWSDLFSYFLLSPTTVKGVAFGLLGVAGLAFNFYVLYVSIALVFLSR